MALTRYAINTRPEDRAIRQPVTQRATTRPGRHQEFAFSLLLFPGKDGGRGKKTTAPAKAFPAARISFAGYAYGQREFGLGL